MIIIIIIQNIKAFNHKTEHARNQRHVYSSKIQVPWWSSSFKILKLQSQDKACKKSKTWFFFNRRINQTSKQSPNEKKENKRKKEKLPLSFKKNDVEETWGGLRLRLELRYQHSSSLSKFFSLKSKQKTEFNQFNSIQFSVFALRVFLITKKHNTNINRIVSHFFLLRNTTPSFVYSTLL